MPVFAYKGLNEAGKEVRGLLDAESPRTLRTQLKKQGIRIIEHREETLKKGSDKPTSSILAAGQTEVDFKRYFDRVSIADIALITRQLSTLLKSGITLIESLAAILDQVDSEKLKRILGDVKTAV